MALLTTTPDAQAASSLARPARPLAWADWPPERLRDLVRDLLLVLHQHQGLDIAAPQLGLDLQVAVVDTRRDGPLLLINPRITRRSRDTEDYDDACLSLPGWQGTVRRPLRAWVQYQDQTGAWRAFCASGLTGRVVQHEIDHLEGRLYPQRLAPGAALQAADPASLADDALAALFDSAPRRLPNACTP